MASVDNPYSGIINLMKTHGAADNAPNIMLGEVLTVSPNLTIKAGDLQLDKDNLFIADYLLSGYKRSYNMEGVMHAQFDGNFATTNSVSDGGYQASAHTHNVKDLSLTTTKDNFSVHGDGANPADNDGSASGKYLTFKDTLKKSDMVALQQFPGTNQFLVYCKVARL
jgi:hypothetical protein